MIDEVLDPRIRKRTRNRGCVVGRMIVHDDEFEILEGLVEHTFDGAFQQIRTVMGWNDNREKRVIHSVLPPRHWI